MGTPTHGIMMEPAVLTVTLDGHGDAFEEILGRIIPLALEMLRMNGVRLVDLRDFGVQVGIPSGRVDPTVNIATTGPVRATMVAAWSNGVVRFFLQALQYSYSTTGPCPLIHSRNCGSRSITLAELRRMPSTGCAAGLLASPEVSPGSRSITPEPPPAETPTAPYTLQPRGERTIQL